MTDTPGWGPPTEPDAGAAGRRRTRGGKQGATTPGPDAPGPAGATPPGPPPQAPPGWGAPAPGAPYGFGPPGSFGTPPGAPPPGYGGGYGGGYGTVGQPAAPDAPGAPGYGAPGGAPPGWGRVGAPEPGVIPLRPLGVGEILDGGFAIVRQYPKVTLGLSAIVVGVTQLLIYLTQLPTALEEGGVDPSLFGGLTFARIIALLITLVGVLVLAGMLTWVVGEAVLGRETTIGETWRTVRGRFWPLLGASLLGTIVPVIGLVLCVAPGAFLWGAWAFLTPVVVLERSGVVESIRRSWRLAVPDFWRVWSIRALATILAVLINTIITGPISLIVAGEELFSPDPHIGVVPLTIITAAGILAGTVTAPFTSSVLALLYLDRRMRAEGLDVTLARSVAQGTA